MKNKKGFTLVELMVAIVILGVILGMSWPVIRRLQEDNTYKKYENYGEALVTAAKLYVDAYEEDLFLYEDDLEKMTEDQKNAYYATGQLMAGDIQCVFITFQDFRVHSLVKDINMENISCNSPYTFVRVIKNKRKYSYKYYLGCGRRKRSSNTDNPLTLNQIDFSLPDQENILPLEGNYLQRCQEE